jgi:hypothetical protein
MSVINNAVDNILTNATLNGATSCTGSLAVTGNASANNYAPGTTAVTTTGGTTTLTATSTQIQFLLGTGGTLVLPAATTLFVGFTFIINNNSSGTITVETNGGATLFTMTAGSYVDVICLTIGTSAGTWDYHWKLPSVAAWGTGGLTTALTITPTTNQLVLGTTNTTTISSTAPAASRIYTIPDAGGAANFLMSAGTQTIAGANTFSSAVTITPVTNQLVLGTTNTTTLNCPAPASSIALTFPNTAQTMVGRTTTDTLANKSFSNRINAISSIFNSPLSYSTGTVTLSSSNATIAGGGSFTPAMVGGLMVLNDGTEAFIVSYTSSSVVNIQDSYSAASQTFIIYYGGFQSNLNIALTSGWTAIQNFYSTGSIVYPYSTIATTGATNPTALNSGQTIGIPVLTGNATATLPAVALSNGVKFRYVVTSGVTALGFTFTISTTDSHVLSGNYMLVSVNTTVTFGTNSTLTFSATTAKNGDWLEFFCLNGKWLVSGAAFGSAAIAVA